MEVLLVFSLTLLAAVMLSGIARRGILSTAVLFLVVGFVAGQGVLGLISIQPDDTLVTTLAELALVSVLFTEGMGAGLHDLTSAWRLPGRALFLGLPLTLLGTAALAHWIAGLPWPESFLLGAILSPTDPVFAAAVVGEERVPLRLRRLLNVESGLNDGLSLPIVLFLLGRLGASQGPPGSLLVELLLGVALGIAMPWIILRIERLPFLYLSTTYEPLNAFAIGMVVLSVGYVTNANLFLAAFVAGSTVATTSPGVRDAFLGFGESITELTKLAALLVFGALISPEVLSSGISLGGYIFAALALLVVRFGALGVALFGTRIPLHEWLVAGWFGPKGFATMVYGLLVLRSGVPQASDMFHLVVLVVGGSILIHSSTDSVVALWFKEARAESEASPEQQGDQPSLTGPKEEPPDGGEARSG